MSGPASAFVELEAPAKVNLGLRIVGVREDGYHRLESLFVPLDLHDRLRVEVEASAAASSVELDLLGGPDPITAATVPAGDDNLVVRAARAWLEAAGRPARVRIRLHKEIPAAAGLGGGSSDAAAVLRALDELLGDVFSPRERSLLALRLGADVPFFLDPRPTLVTGIGEGLEPIEGWPALWLLLVNPGISLATAEVYGAADALAGSLTTVEPGSTMRAISGLRNHPGAHRDRLDGLLENDLEPAAVRLCPPIGRLREALERGGAQAVGMSGSGATVFGVFESRGDAEQAQRDLGLEPPAWSRVARTGGS